jgi:hypothetical protein
MTKAELLIEYIIRDVIEYYLIDNGVELKEAMTRFYGSQVFMKLEDIETELYLNSSAYVYDLFCDEIKYGKIMQFEV